MKKVLLGSAAIVFGLALAAPAKAEGVKLDLGGHFKGYGVWHKQDSEDQGVGTRSTDFLRETEIHFTGETTLDNGLTVGFHAEAEADAATNRTGDGFEVEESYAYFSGAWGRVNLGAEDGAAYLLQVAAPSADSNVDGIRSYVSGYNWASSFTGGFTGAIGMDNMVLDYDNAVWGLETSNKLTYLTPVLNGFQAGFSYTPEVEDNVGVRTFGVAPTGAAGTFDKAYEAALRWEGQVGEFGIAAGAGWSRLDLTSAPAAPVAAPADDNDQWNVGLDLNWGAFGIGAAYMENDGETLRSAPGSTEQETWVVGIDYTTGPFKLGASYLNREQDLAGLTGVAGKLDADRFTGGVVYTYGPGMTFRGSISYVDIEVGGAQGATNGDSDATTLLIGTQIDF